MYLLFAWVIFFTANLLYDKETCALEEHLIALWPICLAYVWNLFPYHLVIRFDGNLRHDDKTFIINIYIVSPPWKKAGPLILLII